MNVTLANVLRLLAFTAVAVFAAVNAAEPPKATVKSESFDRDPGWEARNNRIVPAEYPSVVQNFGYSPTKHAGKASGEMGGTITRGISSSWANRAACTGPAPPKATSVNSRGSWPRSTETIRRAAAIPAVTG